MFNPYKVYVPCTAAAMPTENSKQIESNIFFMLVFPPHIFSMQNQHTFALQTSNICAAYTSSRYVRIFHCS